MSKQLGHSSVAITADRYGHPDDEAAAARARVAAEPWGDEEPPLVICEADATADVLRRVAAEYVTPITGTRGNTNGFLRTQVAAVAEDRDVLYIGDLDLSGPMIETNIRAVLRDEGWVGEWEHIAMTKRQAQRYRIEPILRTDGRYNDRRPHLAIEVESLWEHGGIVTNPGGRTTAPGSYCFRW